MGEQVFSKIKELGRVNTKREELQEYCLQQYDQIIKYISRRILNSDGECLLNCIFNGMPDDRTVSSKNKAEIIEIVLKTMRKESTSLTHCGGVISRLRLELPRMPVEHLVKWCNDSVQSIVDDSDVNMIWRDILPECTSVLSNYDTVKHCGTEMTSGVFKEQCVTALCQCAWSERQLVQLVAMFNEMRLSYTSHQQVVNKMCTYIIDVPPDTLPPLVHQLMKLCKTSNLEIVLGQLSKYFSVRLYSKLEPPSQDSESTTMDIDDIVPYSPVELSRCLSTCIYHISQGVVEPQLIRKHIKAWPKTQLLRAPFIIDLALAISEKGRDFRSVCLDAIKAAIELRVMDEIRSKESALVRSVIPPDVDVASVLKVLTTESANHRQLTVVGLINLAFSLLSVSRLKPTAHTCWSHGKLILVRLSKSHPETTGHILGQLADRLAMDCTQRQYADCLYILCKLTPVSVERCTQLTTILENCRPSASEYRAGAAVLDAVRPLLNYSTRCRDALVMVCRKGLYSRDSLHRCLALSGFLTVLRNMKLSRNAFSSSQSVCSDNNSNESAASYLTQLTVDFHATEQGATVVSRVHNEAVCMEVVSIIRRCLMQDATVKQLLYTSIYDCAKEKAALHESILEMFCDHLRKYLPEGDDTAPLLWNECVHTTGATVVLSEPIAHLLYTVAQFLQATEEESLEDILASQTVDTASAYLKSTLTMTLNKLCDHENLGQIDLDDPGLTDLTPESRAKCIIVQQMLQCYETIIAYKIMMWNNDSDVAATVYKLYKDCNQLLDLAKGAPKASKKGAKSLNNTKDTVKSQKSQKSQKENRKGPIKAANLVKDRCGPFKPLPCVWDVRFCARIVQLLYSEEVPWCSLEQRNQIRGRRDFHQWAMRCVQSVLCEHVDKRAMCHVLSIATVLYTRCVCRFQAMCEFDDQTTLSCLELFRTCLNLLTSPNNLIKLESILPKITGSAADSAISANIVAILEHVHTALMHIELENELEERDLMVKKLLSALLSLATVLLDTPAEPSSSMCNIIVKLEDYVRTSKQDWLPLLPSLLAASYREQPEAQLLDDLLIKLTTSLGRIDEEDTSAGADESGSFPFIDPRTGQAALAHVCGHLGSRFVSVTHLLHRARDLATLPHQRTHRELKELYQSIVVQLCQLTKWTARCAKLRCSIGAGSDKVLHTCVKLYSLLAALTAQIDVATLHTVRFERLLKLSGKKLSAVTDNFITYLEASQAQQSAQKVLRDTKLIPRLVLEAELFSKHVILLAGKAKLNWQQYISLGTARDFRIKTSVLEEVLNTRDAPDEQTRDEDGDSINDVATEIVSPVSKQPSLNHSEDGVTSKKKSKIDCSGNFSYLPEK